MWHALAPDAAESLPWTLLRSWRGQRSEATFHSVEPMIEALRRLIKPAANLQRDLFQLHRKALGACLRGSPPFSEIRIDVPGEPVFGLNRPVGEVLVDLFGVTMQLSLNALLNVADEIDYRFRLKA